MVNQLTQLGFEVRCIHLRKSHHRAPPPPIICISIVIKGISFPQATFTRSEDTDKKDEKAIGEAEKAFHPRIAVREFFIVSTVQAKCLI